jgi:hypothetical protein
MADRNRIRLAALVTALFIGGLSLAGIGLRHQTVAQSTGVAQARSAHPNVATAAYEDEGAASDDD